MKVNWPTVGPLLAGYLPLLRLELSPTHFVVDLVTESCRVCEAITSSGVATVRLSPHQGFATVRLSPQQGSPARECASASTYLALA
jgi:hypothetical protein